MTIYINTATNEYPRYQGDVELDPTAPWAEVEDTPVPSEINEGYYWIDGVPVLENGIYKRTWVQKELPKPTVETVLFKLGITEQEFKLLIDSIK